MVVAMPPGDVRNGPHGSQAVLRLVALGYRPCVRHGGSAGSPQLDFPWGAVCGCLCMWFLGWACLYGVHGSLALVPRWRVVHMCPRCVWVLSMVVELSLTAYVRVCGVGVCAVCMVPWLSFTIGVLDVLVRLRGVGAAGVRGPWALAFVSFAAHLCFVFFCALCFRA